MQSRLHSKDDRAEAVEVEGQGGGADCDESGGPLRTDDVAAGWPLGSGRSQHLGGGGGQSIPPADRLH